MKIHIDDVDDTINEMNNIFDRIDRESCGGREMRLGFRVRNRDSEKQRRINSKRGTIN